MKQVTGRFAPSPTGRMHLGNVFSALLSWLSAKSNALTTTATTPTPDALATQATLATHQQTRSQEGSWLLRIEDIDPQRSKQQWADLIMQDLEWLGLTWDKGPYYQSQRSDIYQHYLNDLKSQDLIYPSYKTRAERLAVSAPQQEATTAATSATQQEATPHVQFSEALPQSQQAADTLRVADCLITYTDGHYGPQTIDMRRDIGDFIVRRRDGAWAYQLAVVVDDALMGITEVVRGRDLLQSAGQQIYLRRLLGFEPSDSPAVYPAQPRPSATPHPAQPRPSVTPHPAQLRYAHLPLLCNTAGQRLSKRDKSLDLGVLREHYTAPEIIGRLAYYANLIPEYQPITPQQLITTFSWEKIPTDNILITP